MEKLFQDRLDAGRQLAKKLKKYAGIPGLLILGLPRGGVVVAYEVAAALHAPMDVLIVRKLGVPGHEELAMGAIASGGVRILNDSVVRSLNISADQIEEVAAHEMRELKRREEIYRGKNPAVNVKGRTVILVDDGLATGATMYAAASALKKLSPEKLIIAVPVASAETCREFRQKGLDVTCLYTPAPFYGVGMWYEKFDQTSDEEVKKLLKLASGQNFTAENISNH